jgi:hypothetical protein
MLFLGIFFILFGSFFLFPQNLLCFILFFIFIKIGVFFIQEYFKTLL